MENNRLRRLNGQDEEATLRGELRVITGLLKDILSELKAINGSDIDEQKARAEFFEDAHHFDGSGNPMSAYSVADEFRQKYPQYFTTNLGEEAL